jgi:hypothetical protein
MLGEVLGSEPVLSLAGAVVALVWSSVKAGAWRRRLRDERYSTAIDAVEHGVRTVYESYVRSIKASRANGKLSDGERKEARRQARQAAVAWGETHGVDVVREVGHASLDLAIERVLEEIKSRRGK